MADRTSTRRPARGTAAQAPDSRAAARGFAPAPLAAPPGGAPGVSPATHDFGRLPVLDPAGAPVQGVLQAREAAGGAPGRNRTGLPDRLKSGLENLSGMDLSGVRVHRNSSAPQRVQALAYTQGSDIHVAPGQDRHLAHEGWHAVQQMEGRVRPTTRANGVAINDDAGLEREADEMGRKALQGKSG